MMCQLNMTSTLPEGNAVVKSALVVVVPVVVVVVAVVVVVVVVVAGLSERPHQPG